ncbi:hypothetical protein ONS95_000503 [Cadophora gregata]|uniref:uncharacterized protein n=1 Tax=Cadophora gregata TaxID=51156 RepID=UPI0026DD967B|nr:uncharacterized protein ONS95_000503 [Cadophora gregata]KAK0125490.1 hypothetical protein ONS96_009327 [Cadophora gregata f. sp. sojae]KAK0128536.1 hypothetical protein ONS95_000503 [Cadophora gregata]
MCIGDIHDDWFCCRPYLLSLLSSMTFHMSPDTHHLINSGASNSVMRQFPGYPVLQPPPATIIEVQRDYWALDKRSKTTRYYYFAVDQVSGVWYEIGTDRWMALRSGMTLHSHVMTFCRTHRVAHSFQTYKSHATMQELYPGFAIPS